MIKLKVNNFGPIKNGFSANEGFLNIKPVTFFIGNQATGKSAVAKLISLFLWLEKAFLKSIYSVDTFSKNDFLYLLSNHKIESYLKEDTVLEYCGIIYRFSYKQGRLDKPEFFPEDLSRYRRPKIMYVPAERNILSVLSLSDFENVSNLSEMLRVFHSRYENALSFSVNKDFVLPVSNITLHYSEQSGKIFISSKNNENIPIEQSSSGIQSIAPLSVVSNYLSDLVNKDLLTKLKSLTINSQKLMKKALSSATDNVLLKESIDETFSNILISGKDNPDKNLALLPLIEKNIHFFFNTCFANIVEEPELNLFPASQSSVLYELLKCYNKSFGNMLVVTTHSPYFISDLSLCIKSYDLKKKGVPVSELSDVVPENSYVSGNDCIVYETTESGEIKRLETYGPGIPSDDNELNLYLDMSNKKYDRLLDMQEKYL